MPNPPGSAQTLAGILAPLWMRPVPEEELNAITRAGEISRWLPNE